MGIVGREHASRTVRRRRGYVWFSPAANVIACLFLTACAEPDSTDRRASSASRPAEADSASCPKPTTLSGRLEFASAERGGEILGRADQWARQLSEFDRAARQRTMEPTTTEELLAFVTGNTWYADHVSVRVDTRHGPAEVVPLIRPTIPLAEVIQLPIGGPPAIGRHIEMVLVAVDPQTRRVLRDADGAPIIHPLDDTDLVDRMARNTSYTLHPQEVIADNFALLMEWRATGVQPDVVPGGPGEGSLVNDVPLLREMERVLTHGCSAAGGITGG